MNGVWFRALPVLIVACVVATMMNVAQAQALEPQQGVEYGANTAIEFPALGIAFTIPEGWSGGVPSGGDVFLLARPGVEGQIVLAADKMDRDEVRKRMSEPVPVDEGVVLQPAGPASGEGDRLTNTYKLDLFGTVLEAQAFGRVGAHGYSVVGLGIYAPGAAGEIKQALDQIEKSLKQTAPVKPAPAPAAAQQAAGGADRVAGHRVIRFIHGGAGGYNSREDFVFCSDGTFFRNYSGGGASTNAAGSFSMATQSGGDGRYVQNGGTIDLHWNNGEKGRFNLQRVDGQLMINGNRWFMERQDRCP
jgi:hypothetical protein